MRGAIVIRHGDDHVEDPTYRLDPKLSYDSRNDIALLVPQLLKEFGTPPKEIRHSPFRRAYETACLLRTTLSTLGHSKIKLKEDPDLSRYFTRKERQQPLAPSTVDGKPPIIESHRAFKKRCHSITFRDGIWYVTHALILKIVAARHGVELSETIPFLGYLPIRLEE